jgi:carboxypeptidase Q
MRKVVEPVTRLAPDRMPFSLIPAESLLGGGSDHTPFIDAGVPGFFWNQDGKSNYRCMHHTQYDTLDAAIPEYQRHSAMVVAITAYGLANLDRMLDRTNSAPIPRRQLGVDFDGLTVRKVEDAGKAKKAGWKVGDLLVEVEGKKVEGRRDLYRAVLDGGPTKKFVLKRKGKTIESAIDFSDDPAERERARRQKEREQRFGPDVMKGATERDNSRALGDNTKSCKPGATG